MANKPGLVLAVAGLTLCAGLAWIALSPLDTPTAAADTARALPVERSSATHSAIDAVDVAQDTHRALEVDAPAEAARAGVASRPPFDTDGAIWVEGRVIFPPATPVDERAQIVANFSEDESKKPHRARVAYDGAFRVAFPAGTEKGWLELRARYLFLYEPLRLEFADPLQPLVLEPELGGCVHATFVLPVGCDGREGELIGTKVSAYPMNNLRSSGNSISAKRSAEIDVPSHVDIGGIVPGMVFQIAGDPKSFAPFKFRGARVQPGSVTAIEIRLEIGVSLSGQVVDEREQPIAGAQFELVVANGNETTYSDRDTPTGPDGRFTLQGVRTGQITLTATAPGYLATRERLEPVPDGGAQADLQLVMKRGRSIRGRVQWSDGRPAADAKLAIALVSSTDTDRQWEELGSQWGAQEYTAAADGTFEISGLTAGPFVLIARAASATDASPRASARADAVAGGGEPLVLTLDAGHEIRGRVVDDTGHAVERFSVDAMPTSSDSSWQDIEDSVSGRSLREDGRFVVEGLRAGNWRISARGGGGLVRREVSVPGDGAALEILLPRPASITGVVLDPIGQAVRGARVSYSPAMTLNASDDTRVTSKPTGVDGRFALEMVSSGPGTLSANHFSWSPSEPASFDLAPAEVRADVTATLRASGRIAGEVRDANGRAEVARPIYLSSSRGVSGMSAYGETDSDGRFEFEGLPAGEYSLQTQSSQAEQEAARGADGQTDWTALQSLTKRAQATVVAGQTTHVVLGDKPRAPVRVSGRVTSRGRAIGSMSVSATRSDPKGGARETKTTRTGDDGGYELVLDEPGLCWFGVSGLSRGTYCRRQETIPEQAQATVDFELEGGRIAGRVLWPEGGPAPEIRVELRSTNRSAYVPGVLRTDYGYATTGADGRFAFEFLLAGVYKVHATDPASWGTDKAALHGPAIADGLVLQENAAIDDLELKLELAARLEVEVVGPGGEPVAGAEVFTFEESGSTIDDRSGVVTDAAGRKRIGGLPARRVVLFARKGSLASAVSAPLRLRAGENDHVRLDLRPGTVLDVIVEGPEGMKPGPVIVRDERGIDYSTLRSGNPAASRTAPATRGFAVGPLPPGRYRVTPPTQLLEKHGVDIVVAGEELREVKLTPPK